MRELGVYAGLACLIAILVPISSAYGWDCDDPAVDCNILIVQSAPQAADLQLQSTGATLPSPKATTRKVPTGVDPAAYLAELESDPTISFVEPALKTELVLSESLPFEPNDPLLFDQDHLQDVSGEELAIGDTWTTLTESTVVIAVIDSGIDYNHPDLAANLWTNIGEIPNNGIDDDGNDYVDDVRGYNFFDQRANPIDNHGHGTHMAGVIGAVGNNDVGITGLIWKVEIMPLRFTDDEGIGDTSKAIEAIHYAVENGARVINMSWTIVGTGNSSASLRKTISSYEDDGIVFVTASGNGDENFIGYNIDNAPVYPASLDLPNLITVGAADSFGDLASFSNYGPGSVHLIAPGGNILSTLPGGTYGRMSGTSAATAIVSAAAAMALTKSPSLSGEDVKNLLLQTVNHNNSLEGEIQSAGTLNMFEPLQFLASGKAITEPNFPVYNTSANTDPKDDDSTSQTQVSSSGGCQLNPQGRSQAPLAFMLIGVIIIGLAIIRFS